jgi:hypothetical protein
MRLARFTAISPTSRRELVAKQGVRAFRGSEGLLMSGNVVPPALNSIAAGVRRPLRSSGSPNKMCFNLLK